MASGLALGLLAVWTSARAASVNWLPPQPIAGDADVATNGLGVFACGTSGTAATVNGVAFAGAFPGNVTVSGSAGTVGNSFAGGTSAPWAGLSPGYQTVLEGGIYANNNAALTVTLTQLTVGRAYLVQLWVNDSRAGTMATRTETVTNTNGVIATLAYNLTQTQGGLGEYIIGSFTADAPSQPVGLTGVLPAGANSSQINALQMRDLQGGTLSSLALIDNANPGQRIDGFGASSAWMSGTLPTNVADLFFSTNVGAGLSLLRTAISPAGTTTEANIAQQAVARGARIWSTPWTPPTNYKATNALGVVSGNGGAYISNPANNAAYAAILAGYAATMSNSYGVPIYAISVQNEPDFDTTNYGSCVWSAQQFHDFIPYFYTNLVASNVAYVKILFPESDVWSQDVGLQSAAMTDPAVAPLVGIIANHNYDGGVAAITNWGKPLWETEVSTFDNYDGSITNAMYWVGRIHAFLTLAQVNAWHYWWLSAGDNEGLTGPGFTAAKRLYALGNYSRFVRPNDSRVGVRNNSWALISAYRGTAGNFTIVAANTNTFAVTQTFTLTNIPAVGPLRTWVTSATESLGNHGGAVTVSNGTFQAVLPPLTVTTFVYQPPVTNPPAILLPPASQLATAGSSVTFTVQAAGGTLPLFYQWLYNGTPLPGGLTNATLVLNNVGATNAGNYAVIVTNYAGSVTSIVASLGLNNLTWSAPVTIAGAADAATNGTLVYAYNDSGSSAVVNGVLFAGQNDYTAWGTGVTFTTGWNATTTSAYGGGSAAPWANLPASYQTILAGGAWNFGGPATVTLNNLGIGQPYAVQVWVNDSRAGASNRTETLTDAYGRTVTLAYNSTYAEGGVGQYAIGTFTAGGATETFTLSGNASTQLNAIQVRNLTLAPVLTQPPASQTAYLNRPVTFSVVANGSAPLNYQWFYHGTTPLAGATNASLSLPAVAATNAGTYAVVVTNYGGSVTSAVVVLTVLPLPHPVITGVRWSATNLLLSGTNGTFAGDPFYTLATTNLTLPLPYWTIVATNAFGPGGGFTATNGFNPRLSPLFWLLKLP